MAARFFAQARCWLALRLTLMVLLSLAALDVSAEQILRRGNQVEPETLDPHRAEGVSTANILRDLYLGLTAEAANGDIIPGAAERWEISADGRRYLFHLRPDARWSNADPVTAEDFVFGLRRSVDPATGSNYSQVLSPIVNAAAVIAGTLPPEALGVKALDALTLEVELIGPTPYFLGLLTHASTYPVHRASLAAYGERFARAGQLVSNGAYVLDEWVVQSHLKLRRNPQFWDAAKVAIDTVYYYPTENVSSELKRYRAGEIDWTYDIPVTQIRWIKENLASEFHTGPYLGMYYFGYNLSQPPFKDAPGLRKALAMTVNRELIVERILGTGEQPAYSWVPPGVWNYASQQVEWANWPMQRRLDEARRLYREAGYGPERPLKVEIRYNTQTDHKRVAIALAWMWKDALGVEASLINEEWKVFLQNRRHRQLTQIFRAAWIGDYNDAMSFAELMHSSHGINDSAFSDPRYDRLLAEIAVEADVQRRQQLLQQAERIVLDEMPVIPLYAYVSRRMIKPYVRGWHSNIMDHHPSRFMSIDHNAATAAAP